ncbi:MAG: hypothetical protein KIT09_33360 [Bryobacteraceae bacterium]|nr:hypothetical protein [Bryobacteraceae bacterium]
MAYARQVEAWYAEFADDSEYVNQIRGELGEFIPPQSLGLEEMAWVGGPIRDGVKLYCKAISRSKAVALVKDQPELYEVQTKKWLRPLIWCLAELVLVCRGACKSERNGPAQLCLIMVEAGSPSEAIEKVKAHGNAICAARAPERWIVAAVREVSVVEGTFSEPVLEVLFYRTRLPLKQWRLLVKREVDLELFSES